MTARALKSLEPKNCTIRQIVSNHCYRGDSSGSAKILQPPYFRDKTEI